MANFHRLDMFFAIEHTKWHTSIFLTTMIPPGCASSTPVLSIKNYFIFKWSFACMHVYAPYACLVPTEFERGHQITWSWSYGLL